MTPHPIDRRLWWLAVAVHACLITFMAYVYAKTGVKACLGIASMSVVLGAFSTMNALGRSAFRKPPFRRPM